MNKPAILITGGAEYIGSYVGLFYAQEGFTVILLDMQHICHYSWAIHITGDYADETLFKLLCKNYSIDVVIHCALVSDAAKHSFDYYQNDLCKTIMLFNLMRSNGIKKCIFTSDASVYGSHNGIMHHSLSKQPNDAYSRTIAMIEDILHDLESEICSAILRCFDVAGELPDYKITHQNQHTTIIPKIIKAFKTDQPLPLYDTQYQTSDGSIVRDYVHIWDIAHAHAKAYEYLCINAQTDYFNIGSNKGVSAKQVITKVELLVHKKINLIRQKNDKKISATVVADISKTIDILGWRPTHSDIEFIVRTAYLGALR